MKFNGLEVRWEHSGERRYVAYFLLPNDSSDSAFRLKQGDQVTLSHAADGQENPWSTTATITKIPDITGKESDFLSLEKIQCPTMLTA